MAEWLVEEGIGEHRAALIEHGEVIAARIDWPGSLSAGLVTDATLISRTSGANRGTVRFATGEEALVSHLPRDASEGAAIRVEVTRAAIAENGRYKRAQTRTSNSAPRPAPTLAEALTQAGERVRVVRRFPEDPWPDVISDAIEGQIAFDGGALVLSPTPAMTLIDIDGTLPPRALCLAAVPALATAIRTLDLAGSIGIDFPSLEGKEDRRAVDEALATALSDWPHQRTGMNGFGFVQLVARLEGPSILHRARFDRSGAAARLLMRSAERVDDPGQLLLTANPAVKAKVLPEWEAELACRTGRTVTWQTDPALAIIAGFAQAVAP